MKNLSATLLICACFSVQAQSLNSCFKVFQKSEFLAGLRAVSDDEIELVARNGYKYLDDSVDSWFRNYQTQRQQKCLSCHTTLPYMMLNASDTVLGQRGKIREVVKKRVENFKKDGFVEADNLPWYELEKSYSTETVLNASSLVLPEKLYNANAQLSELAQDAYDLLWKRQRSDGGFDWLDQFGLVPHESQHGGYWGTSMAGVIGGLVEKETTPQLKKLYGFLKGQFKEQSVHNKLYGVWANSLAKEGKFLDDASIKKLMKQIEEAQKPDGSWSQSFILGAGDEASSPYATAVIAFTLKKSGKEIPNEDLVRNYIMKSFEQTTETTIGQRSMLGAAVSQSPNGTNSTFFSDMATSYGLMYLGK